MYRSSSRAIAAALLVAFTSPTLSAPALAAGSDAGAAELVKEGIAAERAGRFAQAIAAFRRAIALQDGASARHHLALAEEASGKLPEAFGDYEQAIVLGQQQRASDIVGAAQRRVAELKKRVGALRIDVRERPGLAIMVDGGDVPASTAGRAFYVTAGSHTIDVRAPGAEPQQVSVLVEAGKQLDVTIALRARVAALSGDPVGAEARRGGSPWPWVFWGVGAAGLAVGVAYGIDARNKRDALKQDCPGDICPPEREQQLLDGKFAARVSTEGFAVGAAGLALGTWLFFRQRDESSSSAASSRVQPWLGAGSAGVVGAF